MDKLYLIATIAGQGVAIRAALVDSVVEIGAVSPVPLAAPHIAGLAALRSRLLTIICSEHALGITPSGKASSRAVIVEVEGHYYGLVVGTIDDARIIEADPVPIRARLEHGWARVALGTIEFEGESLILIDPHRLIAGPEEMAA